MAKLLLDPELHHAGRRSWTQACYGPGARLARPVVPPRIVTPCLPFVGEGWPQLRGPGATRMFSADLQAQLHIEEAWRH